MTALYRTSATAWGGREGRVATQDSRLDVKLSIPHGLGGDDGPGTNPEQMFAAGYAACFHAALRSIASGKGLDVSESAVTVSISLVGSVGQRRLDLVADIEVEVPGLDAETAHDLVSATHELCPYSRATRGNIAVSIQVVQGD